MTAQEFRKELVKLLPGYDWTVHRSSDPKIYLQATGIQSSGFNRLSTLEVLRREGVGGVKVWYEVRSSGFGAKAPWLATRGDITLTRAIRVLQEHYEHTAAKYSNHASAIKYARHQSVNKKEDSYGKTEG